MVTWNLRLLWWLWHCSCKWKEKYHWVHWGTQCHLHLQHRIQTAWSHYQNLSVQRVMVWKSAYMSKLVFSLYYIILKMSSILEATVQVPVCVCVCVCVCACVRACVCVCVCVFMYLYVWGCITMYYSVRGKSVCVYVVDMHQACLTKICWLSTYAIETKEFITFSIAGANFDEPGLTYLQFESSQMILGNHKQINNPPCKTVREYSMQHWVPPL